MSSAPTKKQAVRSRPPLAADKPHFLYVVWIRIRRDRSTLIAGAHFNRRTARDRAKEFNAMGGRELKATVSRLRIPALVKGGAA